MFRAFLRINEVDTRVPGVFTRTYDARIEATDHFLETPTGQMLNLRMRGAKLPWKSIEPYVITETAIGEWIECITGEEYPEECDEPGTVLFYDKKKKELHFGSYDPDSESFIEAITEKTFTLAKVSKFFIIPEPTSIH